MQREIVLDTETTGMDPAEGHRIIEIGCVELVNHLPSGITWHEYMNPEREVEAGAVAVHGIKTEFLQDKPLFAELAGSFLDFIKGARLVIHNAEFDIKFLNAELGKLGFSPIKIADVTDTLLMARKKFPGQPANLDALCRRFGIDLSARDYHGALLDSQLLAEVYLELLGGRQHGLGLDPRQSNQNQHGQTHREMVHKQREIRPARPFTLSPEDKDAHEAMLARIKEPLWKKM